MPGRRLLYLQLHGICGTGTSDQSKASHCHCKLSHRIRRPDWTIQSGGTTTVWCEKTSTCQNIRLLGRGIKAHCKGLASCQAADCEGGAKIVECTGTSSCQANSGCGVPSQLANNTATEQE